MFVISAASHIFPNILTDGVLNITLNLHGKVTERFQLKILIMPLHIIAVERFLEDFHPDGWRRLLDQAKEVLRCSHNSTFHSSLINTRHCPVFTAVGK